MPLRPRPVAAVEGGLREMSLGNPGRGGFGSGIGFVLAAAGSAIGLGNIWGFPYKAAESGGGAFVTLYLVCVVLIGVPVLLGELSIGRAAQRSPVGAFRKLAPGTRWPWVGGIGIATGFGILAFYSVIAGWTMGYLAKAVLGKFRGGMTMEQSEAAFEALRGNPLNATLWTLFFFVLTILVVRGGIRSGIERISKILMPVFFVLLIALALRSLTLDTEFAGVKFLFHFDFTKITPAVVLNALAQALFSLSLGMGAMITYGSYLSRKENLLSAGISVAMFDTMIALLSGLMIFPALFVAGAEPAGDEGLVFQVLPTIFQHLPMGDLFAVAFYLLLAIAALTSSISLLEVVVSYFVDERGWSREKASWILGALCFLLAIPCAVNQEIMGTVVKLFYVYTLAIGALLICLFVGWKWGTEAATDELGRGVGRSPLLSVWAVLIKWFCPIVAAIIVGQRILALFG